MRIGLHLGLATSFELPGKTAVFYHNPAPNSPLTQHDNAGIITFYSYLFFLLQARNLSHVLITSCTCHTLFLTSLLYLVTLKRHKTLTGLSYQSCSFYSYFCWHSHNVRFMFVSRKLRKLLDTSISFYYLLLVSTTFYYVLQGSLCFYKEDIHFLWTSIDWKSMLDGGTMVMYQQTAIVYKRPSVFIVREGRPNFTQLHTPAYTSNALLYIFFYFYLAFQLETRAI